MLKIVTIVGARPQFIKAAAISRAIAKHNESRPLQDRITEVIVHTGQHYDKNMSQVFFDELKIPHPDYNLGIGSDSHGRQTGKMLVRIEEALIREMPHFVLTYGDTNSTLAGALAASKLRIPSAHVEAGLRSYNRKMPEEINRIVADKISNILFCPTTQAAVNLASEGIATNKKSDLESFGFNSQLVYQVGDVMYDSLIFNEKLSTKKSEILKKFGLRARNYFLATLHRAENTDDSNNLQNILDALSKIASAGKKIILPLHPRTRKSIKKLALDPAYGLKPDMAGTFLHLRSASIPDLIFIEPVGYLDMIQLEKNSAAIFTDSGGVQKEAYFLNVPCITLRTETEWIETVENGWNVLTGADTKKIVDAYYTLSGWEDNGTPFTYKPENSGKEMDISSISDSHDLTNQTTPYGNGKAAEKIVDILWKIFTTTYRNL